MVAHERLELLPNKDYWDKARIPKQDRLILLPMQEASTRTAALLSGQVNFVEAPSPDAIPRLKAAGMRIVTAPYPHNWGLPAQLHQRPLHRRPRPQGRELRPQPRRRRRASRRHRPRKARPTSPPAPAISATPSATSSTSPRAKALLKEANCLPCKVTFAISTSGSGQMQPLPMNELVKSQLEEAGFQVTLQVMDWNAPAANRPRRRPRPRRASTASTSAAPSRTPSRA